MQARAYQLIQIMPVDQLVNDLLDAPALLVPPDALLRTEALGTRHVHPRPAAVGGLPGGQSKQLQAGIPVAVAQPDNTRLPRPAALRAGEGGQARPDRRGASKAEKQRDARRAPRGHRGMAGEAARPSTPAS